MIQIMRNINLIIFLLSYQLLFPIIIALTCNNTIHSLNSIEKQKLISDKIKVGYFIMPSQTYEVQFQYLNTNTDLLNIFEFIPIRIDKYLHRLDELVCYCEQVADVVINNLYPLDTYNIFKNRDNRDIINIMLPKTNVSLLADWDDKKKFKMWMIRHGFEDYVPKLINPNNLTFPLIMKGTVSFGTRHVFLVHDEEEYNKQIKILIHDGQDMLLEEALTGMGRMEGDVFGSAFEGEIVSMRCQINPFYENPHDISSSKAHNDLYLRNGNRYPKYLWASCGLELVNKVKEIFRIAKFTGAFGISFKMNNEKHIKFFDMNPRINGDHYEHGDFFIMNYIPLIFRMRTYYAILLRGKSHYLTSTCNRDHGWCSNDKLLKINEVEKRVVELGKDGIHDFIPAIIKSVQQTYDEKVKQIQEYTDSRNITLIELKNNN